MKSMKTLLAGAVLATSMVGAGTLSASAQQIYLGPNGPGVDLRSRAQRDRDDRREMMRRDDDRYYRQQRFGDRRDRGYRRDYDY